MASQPRRRGLNTRRGFTLTEVIISSTLCLIVVSGILSTMLLFVRNGYQLSSYSDMEQSSRRVLEAFGMDARMAQSATWNNSSTSISFQVMNGAGTATEAHTYFLDGTDFKRTTPDGTTVLMSGVTSFTMSGYRISDGSRIFDPANPSGVQWVIASNDTKQVQLTMVAARTRSTVANSTQKIISARFNLRNKS